MAEEKDAFYVVKKGDVVGIYKSFSDIQPLLASSVSGDPVSIYKGYSLPQKSEEYLVSHGLKGAPYSIGAADVHEGLFGRLVACPYQDPYSYGGRTFDVSSSSKNLRGAIQFDTSKLAGSSIFPTNSQRNHALGGSQAELSICLSCTLQFDGASKGNPGPAGAGAILRDGSKVYRLREGVGIQTNNVAEYRGLILGLKHALKKGYKHILVHGDSLLVCNQIQGLWKIKNQNMASLCSEAKELKDKFLSFKISHVLREYNCEADVQANLATNLRAGEVQEDCQLL
ncbi:ribonuclease HI [Spatholobus suberectus]|nr:ribonuclease HI [Spatholobus suberectus]